MLAYLLSFWLMTFLIEPLVKEELSVMLLRRKGSSLEQDLKKYPSNR